MLSVNVAAEIVEIINKHIAVRILISFIKWMFKSILNEDCYKLVYCFFTDIYWRFYCTTKIIENFFCFYVTFIHHPAGGNGDPPYQKIPVHDPVIKPRHRLCDPFAGGRLPVQVHSAVGVLRDLAAIMIR